LEKGWKTVTTVQLSDRDLATILAALRHWQEACADNGDEEPISPEYFDDAITPLTVTEIDDLCERINFGQ
jgi:hypothetical protein